MASDSLGCVFEVESIIQRKFTNGIEYFKVRWKGYEPEEDTWEPRQNLIECDDLVEQFLKSIKESCPSKKKSNHSKSNKKSNKKARRKPIDKEGNKCEIDPNLSQSKIPQSTGDLNSGKVFENDKCANRSNTKQILLSEDKEEKEKFETKKDTTFNSQSILKNDLTMKESKNKNIVTNKPDEVSTDETHNKESSKRGLSPSSPNRKQEYYGNKKKKDDYKPGEKDSANMKSIVISPLKESKKYIDNMSFNAMKSRKEFASKIKSDMKLPFDMFDSSNSSDNPEYENPPFKTDKVYNPAKYIEENTSLNKEHLTESSSYSTDSSKGTHLLDNFSISKEFTANEIGVENREHVTRCEINENNCMQNLNEQKDEPKLELVTNEPNNGMAQMSCKEIAFQPVRKSEDHGSKNPSAATTLSSKAEESEYELPLYDTKVWFKKKVHFEKANKPLSYEALLTAVKDNDIVKVSSALYKGHCHNLNQSILDGSTLLTTAAYRGYDEIIEFLLLHGADPNLPDSNSGSTPIIIAAEMFAKTKKMENEEKEIERKYSYTIDFERCLAILLEKGAFINVQNNRGDTALHIACRSDSPRLVDLLLRYGANFGVANKMGLTAFNVGVGKSLEIISDHVQTLIENLQHTISYVSPSMALVKPLFDLQLYSICEGPLFILYFNHRLRYELEYIYILVLAPTDASLLHRLKLSYNTDRNNSVTSVLLNDREQNVISPEGPFIFCLVNLVNGRNELVINTINNSKSQCKLLVRGYKVRVLI